MAALAGPRTRTYLEQASAPLLQEGTQAATLTLEGSRALVFYRRDLVECERRRTQQAAPLGIGDLTALQQLPIDCPVALDDLPEALRTQLPALPHAAVRLVDGMACRLAVRPLTLDLVVVWARGADWRDGLARAGRFAPFARRALLVDAPAQQRQEMLMEAAFYGIGVLEPTDEGIGLTLEPRPYRPRRHTPVAWHFIEQLHQRLP